MISRVIFLDNLTDEQADKLQKQVGDDFEVNKQGQHGWTEMAHIHVSSYSDEEEDEFESEETADEKQEYLEQILSDNGISFEVGSY